MDENKYLRGGNDKVAVNPERVVTLMELAVEHYGNRCARCTVALSRQRKGVVHHRHYRTLGFEKPVDDIVLLCRQCHAEIHNLADTKLLTSADIPFVDPKWASWLNAKPRRRTQDEINASWPEGVYNPSAWADSEKHPYLIKIDDHGNEYGVVEFYPNDDVANAAAKAQCEFFNCTRVVSVSKLARDVKPETVSYGRQPISEID